MFLFLNLILNIGLIATICLYIFRIVQDINKLRSKGNIYLTSKLQMNEVILLTIVMTVGFSIIYIPQNEDAFQKVIIAIFGIVVVGYWAYRAFSKKSICEYVIITNEYIYSAKSYIGHEWATMMEEEGTSKLWIKLKRKSLFGRDITKEVYFILKNEQVHMIEELLNNWKR
ncbi:hypothetical protein [Cellulosilyticum sp. I15G10I2]|uniref:hypothetical protein n=1 Tax=Cellulosilyticum sp. I15G10I2 TaxID=1892843 RepID=UPI00085C1C2E|nr:hypothetical protein [Cellulosilyticum sp. I15G10I2]